MVVILWTRKSSLVALNNVAAVISAPMAIIKWRLLLLVEHQMLSRFE
jgi:hypothetical protein